MSRFNDTKVNLGDGTVEVGAGLTWDQVYEALEPTGVNVVGGRIPGVGVAGLTLGGGGSSPIRPSRRIDYDLGYLQAIHTSRTSMGFPLTTLQDMNSSYQTELSKV
jgi:hypothetical protein